MIHVFFSFYKLFNYYFNFNSLFSIISIFSIFQFIKFNKFYIFNSFQWSHVLSFVLNQRGCKTRKETIKARLQNNRNQKYGWWKRTDKWFDPKSSIYRCCPQRTIKNKTNGSAKAQKFTTKQNITNWKWKHKQRYFFII